MTDAISDENREKSSPMVKYDTKLMFYSEITTMLAKMWNI